jgi:hypothetical protein
LDHIDTVNIVMVILIVLGFCSAGGIGFALTWGATHRKYEEPTNPTQLSTSETEEEVVQIE